METLHAYQNDPGVYFSLKITAFYNMGNKSHMGYKVALIAIADSILFCNLATD